MNWQTLTDLEREREYSPSSAIGGNYQPFIAQYLDLSAQARMRFCSLWRGQAHFDVAYGEAASQTLDVFLPNRDAYPNPPLLVFIHGGYWQELSKNESQFAAIDAAQQGIALAVLDYTLAPAASVGQIVEECGLALRHLTAHAAALGFDAQRIYVAGSSAGAHVAALTALQAQRGAVAGVVLVSGIFELAPLIGTSINGALGLNAASARAMSPQFATPQALASFPPAIVAYGSVETAQFKQQSRDFAALLTANGAAPRVMEIEGRNHFDVILDLCAAGTRLGDAVLQMTHQTHLNKS